MKNKIKTIVAAMALTVSLGASALTYNEGYGIGVVVWYNSACESMSDGGLSSFLGFLSDNGINTAEEHRSHTRLY